VAVNVEISLVTVHAFANVVRHPTHGKNIAAAVEDKRILCIEPLARHHFGMYGLQANIIGLKRMLTYQGGHLLDDIAAWHTIHRSLRYSLENAHPPDNASYLLSTSFAFAKGRAKAFVGLCAFEASTLR
jgi:hypothetical protein